MCKSYLYSFLFLIFLGISILSFPSCQTSISLDLPKHEPVLVVNSYLANQQQVEVYVSASKSKSDFDETRAFQIEAVETAQISIFEDEQLKFMPIHLVSGYYMDSLTIDYPEIGKNYHIRVSADGYETAEAQVQMPERVSIKTAEAQEDMYISTSDMRHAGIHISFDDRPDEANYYFLTLVFKDTIRQRMMHRIIRNLNDVDIQFSLSNPNRLFVSDVFMEGRGFEGTLYVPYDPSDPLLGIYNIVWQNNVHQIGIVLAHINKEMFDYTKAVALQTNNADNPFAEPVIIPTNIQNGLGIFSAYTTDTTWIDWP